MALTETGFYWRVELGAVVPGTRQGRPPVGSATGDQWIADNLRLYAERINTPAKPGPYYDLVQGSQVVNNPYVDRTDSWQEWTPERKRENIADQLDGQVPDATIKAEVEEPTIKGQIEQQDLRRIVATEQLAQTADTDLDVFDTDLQSYPSDEPRYALNLIKQMIGNLILNDKLVDLGIEGFYSAAERTDIVAAIQANASTRRGETTGVTVPERGSPREDLALDGEDSETGSIFETTFDWSGTTYYLPQCRLNRMPDGVNPAQVWLIIYDQDNVYRSWTPFEQQPDGTWLSRAGTNDISAAKTASSRWRAAVAKDNAASDYEITRRVYLKPPNSELVKVRIGGRDGV